jgi:methylmalonyl-CoA mutase
VLSFFAETGFDVDVSPMHQAPQRPARMTTENDVHVICFLSVMNRHKELVYELAQSLKAEDGEDIRLVIGGSVPKSDYELLYRAGVALILESGAVDIELMNRLIDVLEK